MKRLAISENRRFLMYEDGRPFFWLGDTAWELFHRLGRDDAEHYLKTRAAQGFTVIQAVALAEHEFGRANANGDLALVKNDPRRPVEAYFQHVDWIVDRAAALGMFTGMLPTWGDKWNRASWGVGPEIFDESSAGEWGAWLARRYADRPIIWILGGDRPAETEAHRAIIRSMAAGIRSVVGRRQLIAFHPPGMQTSARWFHGDEWLDLNMWQTGHSRGRECWRQIEADYALKPVKPCMDAEPGYEDHPSDFDAKNGYLDDADVRRFAWWDLFAGAHGHTYGCHDIWQFLAEGWTAVTAARTPWREAVQLPGARQMHFARRLLMARPFFTRIPDQGLIIDGQRDGADHLQSTRDSAGACAMVYAPNGGSFAVDLSRLAGAVRVGWYSPRDGSWRQAERMSNRGVGVFTTPTSGRGADWVLVLDEEKRGFRAP